MSLLICPECGDDFLDDCDLCDFCVETCQSLCDHVVRETCDDCFTFASRGESDEWTR